MTWARVPRKRDWLRDAGSMGLDGRELEALFARAVGSDSSVLKAFPIYAAPPPIATFGRKCRAKLEALLVDDSISVRPLGLRVLHLEVGTELPGNRLEIVWQSAVSGPVDIDAMGDSPKIRKTSLVQLLEARPFGRPDDRQAKGNGGDDAKDDESHEQAYPSHLAHWES